MTKSNGFTKSIKAASGHTMFVKRIERADLPKHVAANASEWQTFYEVRNTSEEGWLFFYLAKGYRHPDAEYANDRSAHAPREVTAFYCNGQMWSSFAGNLEDAINGAQRDGWLYTGNE